MVSAALFDAVNGVEHRYRSFFVRMNAPHDASARAAAIQSAYAILVRLYSAPSQVAALTARRDASIAGISSGRGAERARSIASGITWGQLVADRIWAWRATDGFDP